jgi:hypothetical protein
MISNQAESPNATTRSCSRNSAPIEAQNLRDISELSQISLPQDVQKKAKPGIALYQTSTNEVPNVDLAGE